MVNDLKMMDVAVPANMKVGLHQQEVARRGWALSAEQARALIGRADVALIDLREKSERERPGDSMFEHHVRFRRDGRLALKNALREIPGSICAPRGFKAAAVFCDIKRIGTGKGSEKGQKDDLALIVSDIPAAAHPEPAHRATRAVA